MAKRRNVSGRMLRNAVPQPRDVAEFVAPRTVNEGLSVKNVFGDIGDMIDPFITAAIEKQEGLRDVSDDELKMLAALGSIPVAGAVASKVTKKLNKLVPNPKGGFLNVLPIKNDQGRNYLTKATNPEELKILNDGVDIAKEKKIITAEDAEKLKNNFNSTYENDKRKELAVNMGIIDPNIKTSAAMKPLKPTDVSPQSIEDFKKAKEVGKRNRVITKDKGNFEGLNYYTKYDNNSPLLYAEDRLDANIARHNFSNYDDINEKINKEIREALPGENNRIAPVFDKDYKPHNPYKTIVEPTVFDKFKVINNIKASSKSLNKAKEDLKLLDEYVLPDEFYKIILGL